MKIETEHNIGDHVWVARQEETRKQIFCCECHATEAREEIIDGRRVLAMTEFQGRLWDQMPERSRG